MLFIYYFPKRTPCEKKTPYHALDQKLYANLKNRLSGKLLPEDLLECFAILGEFLDTLMQLVKRHLVLQ